MGRPEIQELLLALEEMKMLMSELEILRLFGRGTAQAAKIG